jgi:putative lipoprotein
MKTRTCILPPLLLLILAACNQKDSPALNSVNEESGPAEAMAQITGTVAYRERIALSPGAVLEISLEDVSRADVKATLIARQKITSPGQVPIRFELEYEPGEIDERMSYSIRARISDGGRLMFINDTHTPVLTRGAGNHVDMTLVRVKEPENDPVGIELEGMFSYLADAAVFRDCRTGKTFPVSMEGSYMELENAYLNSGIDPGHEIFIELNGRFLERPAMEGNHNKVKLIVDKLNNMEHEKTCAPTVHAELADTYWKVIEIGGGTVVTPEGMKEAHIILASAESRAHGNAGCNNFFGQFQSEGDTLSFSAVGSTMMLCPQGMDTERAFLEALGSTTRYTISGLFMELYAGDKLLARLEAIYL